MDVSLLYYFFLRAGFAIEFYWQCFNEAVLTNLLKFHVGHSR